VFVLSFIKYLVLCLLVSALTVSSIPAKAAPPSIPIENNDALLDLLRNKGLVQTKPESIRNELVLPAEKKITAQVRESASDLIMMAMNFLGVPYKSGGNTEDEGFDCSGFTRRIFEMSIGLVLPRRAEEQAAASNVVPVSREELKPGDLVFFNTMRRTFSHVGIYIGNGKFIHAPRRGGEVRVEDMRFEYWNTRFTGARRVQTSLDSRLEPTAAGPGSDSL
jgi:cell wall-associated NlpC family hydrolase